MNRNEVNETLKLAKQAITSGRAILLGRGKNLQFLANMGLTKRIALQNILDLTYKDYCKGPDDDHNEPGEVWFFADDICGCEVYVKFKLYGPDNRLKVISYHEAEFPLKRYF